MLFSARFFEAEGVVLISYIYRISLSACAPRAVPIRVGTVRHVTIPKRSACGVRRAGLQTRAGTQAGAEGPEGGGQGRRMGMWGVGWGMIEAGRGRTYLFIYNIGKRAERERERRAETRAPETGDLILPVKRPQTKVSVHMALYPVFSIHIQQYESTRARCRCA